MDLNSIQTLMSVLGPIVSTAMTEDEAIKNPHIFRKQYALGGAIMAPAQPPASTQRVEAEGGEVVQPPMGDAFKLKGNSHKKGGVEIDAEKGTVIYSKRLKGPDGRTMAERKERRDKLLEKLANQLKDNKIDSIHRATIERAMEATLIEDMMDVAAMHRAFLKQNGGMAAEETETENPQHEMAESSEEEKMEEMEEDSGKEEDEDEMEMAQTGMIVGMGKLQQKLKKLPVAQTGMVVPQSGFEGDVPKAKKVGSKYKWDYEFDPYYFQRAYFTYDKPAGMSDADWTGAKGDAFRKQWAKENWDNTVGPKTAAAMATDEGKAIIASLGNMYQGKAPNTPEASNMPTVTVPMTNPSRTEPPIPEEFGIPTTALTNLMGTAKTPYVVDFPDDTQALGVHGPLQQPGTYLPSGEDYRIFTPEDQAAMEAKKQETAAAVPATTQGAAETATQAGAAAQGQPFTPADVATLAGPIGKTLTTIFNRLGDRPTPNYYQDYGAEAMALQAQAGRGLAEERDLEMQRNARMLNALRQSSQARGIGTQRAIDLAALTQAGETQRRISSRFNQLLGQQLQQRANLSLQQNRMLAEGRKFADITDTQNRDNFATQLGTNIGDITRGIQAVERNRERRRLGVQIYEGGTPNALFAEMMQSLGMFGQR